MHFPVCHGLIYFAFRQTWRKYFYSISGAEKRRSIGRTRPLVRSRIIVFSELILFSCFSFRLTRYFSVSIKSIFVHIKGV